MSISEGTIIKIAQSILLPDTQTAINAYWAVVAEDGGTGPLEEDDVLVAAANYMDQIYENIVADLADTVTASLVEVWTVNPVDGDLTPIGDEVATWTPVSTADAFPNGVAAIAALKTTNTDVTGRKFVPGYADTKAIDNNLIGTPLANFVLYAVDWGTQYIDANSVILTPGVWSQTKLNFYLASGVVIANAIVGYQRRRKPGVGT